MNDQPQSPAPAPAPPPATVRSRVDRRWRVSLIWAIPIVTAVLGVWLAWHTLSQRGPLITITFAEHNGQTTMTFHQTPFVNVERRDAHIGGWTSLFNKLAAYAAKQQEQRT